MSSGVLPIRNSKRVMGTTPVQAKGGFTHYASKSMTQLPGIGGKSPSLAVGKLPPLGKLKVTIGLNKELPTPRRRLGTGSPLLTFPEQLSINDFRLMRVIGTGTFSRVRLAQCRRSQEFVVMKIMRKADIVKMKQVDHVRNEKTLLTRLSHPFLVSLRHSFQDRTNLYLELEYVSGGELFRLLRSQGHFSLSAVRFYASEIACALGYLHSTGVVYRDLKPENVLLTEKGHVKLTDFGFAKQLRDGEQAFTLCGTPEYLAPELIQQRGHSFPCDWWGFGILIYEMACGHAPFLDDNPFKLYEKIVTTEVTYPTSFDPVLKELLGIVLDKDVGTRADEGHIKGHRFFRGVDWNKVGGDNPPYVPVVRGRDDTGNFDEYPEEGQRGDGQIVPSEVFANF